MVCKDDLSMATAASRLLLARAVAGGSPIGCRMALTTPTSLTSLLILAIIQGCLGQSCDSSIYVDKIHSWNKGYTGKLYLEQSWLDQQTADWKLAATFAGQLKQFKVWDADIVNPAPLAGKNYVANVSSVEIINKCWNQVLYPCQYLELNFMVRFPDSVSDEFSSDFDLSAVTQTVTYNDGSAGSRGYCGPTSGQPTTPATTG